MYAHFWTSKLLKEGLRIESNGTSFISSLINSHFSLRGSQIQNIKRKLLVDSILFGLDYLNKELLLNYIEEELGFRKKNKTEIGFFFNWKT